MVTKRDIVFEVRDWTDKRPVKLLKTTLKTHVLQFHYDSAFVVDALKRNFGNPICVIENRKHGTENAVYEIPVGGHPLLLVAANFQKGFRLIGSGTNLIKTFYGIERNEIPNGKVLWGRRP